MSTLNVANITDGTNSAETVYVARGSAKAWANFTSNGTLTIRESLNTSSITDHGVGDFAHNFSSAFSSANYSAGGLGSVNPGANGWGDLLVRETSGLPTASSLRIGHIGYTTWTDANYALPMYFGDLA